jgi:acyl-CoA thioester hydrolase
MPSEIVFTSQRRVEFADTDMAGIVHFARFFNYMEEVEHEFLRSRGLSVVMTWENQRLAFPRVSAQCDYQHPIRFEEVMDITLRLVRMGGKSLTYQFGFQKGDQPIALGKLVVCCARMGVDRGLTGAPIPESLKIRLRGE